MTVTIKFQAQVEWFDSGRERAGLDPARSELCDVTVRVEYSTMQLVDLDWLSVNKDKQT